MVIWENITGKIEVPFGLSSSTPELFLEETVINILVYILLDLYLCLCRQV